MRDEANAREALLVFQSSEPSQRIANVQKHAGTICRAVPQYLLKVYADTESGFELFCNHPSAFANKNVQIRIAGILGSITTLLASFEQIV